ncbi:MAG: ABC transporter permease [Pedosphaera sp.]|nr:ABC transporter permease [Pedosphaera sp.]MSU43905.1 ABC transporter permease [Pedosphaera sp.]
MSESISSTNPSPTRQPRTPWQLFWHRLRQRRIALVGGVILVVLYGTALLAGFVAPHNYDREDRTRFFHPPVRPHFEGLRLVVPRSVPLEIEGKQFAYKLDREDSMPLRFFVTGDEYKLIGLIPARLHFFGTADANYPVHLLGTDQLGRDVFSRLLYGSQISLSIGLVGIALTFTIGMLVGGISGYYGGLVDNGIMRLCELIMSVPGLYLILTLRATFPPDLSSTRVYLLIVVILSFIGWASMARVIRGMTLSLRERQYVLAARALGQSDLRIIIRHILPNTFSYVIVAATLSVPYYILGEVILSYLAVGIQEPQASWGLMLKDAYSNYQHLQQFPWLLAPGAAIFVTVLAFNFLGDGLRDAADTKA